MKHSFDSIPVFLSDPSNKQALKDMIAQKARFLDALCVLKEAVLDSDEYLYLREDIRPYFLEKLAEMRYGDEIKATERELRNMRYQLRKSQGEFQQESEWEKMYIHATEHVRIEDVVSALTGQRNFRRNIRCPFHKDKAPSFKIYSNTNSFVCFGCSARGSPIDFVMQHKNYDFKEAIEFVSNY